MEAMVRGAYSAPRVRRSDAAEGVHERAQDGSNGPSPSSLASIEQLHVALPAIIEALRAQALELTNLSTLHATLEDAFVTPTGRALSV